MRYKELLYQGKIYTDKYKIDDILTKHKFTWVLDAELENAKLEIMKDTLIFNSGIWYSGNWLFGVVRGGEFRYVIWENGVFFNGVFWDGIFKSGLIYNGTFYKGKFLGGEVKKTMPKTGNETKQHFVDCEISKNLKGYKDMAAENESILYKKLDVLFLQINESNSINEGKIVDKIKAYVSEFIENNITSILDKLPNLLAYIKKSPIPLFTKKELLFYVAFTLSMFGANMAKAKDIYKETGLYNTVEWSKIKPESPDNNSVNIVDSVARLPFEIGEYTISPSDILSYYKSIKAALPDNTTAISGNIIVTISNDPTNPSYKNVAVDDTQEDIAQGGKLMNKRLSEVNAVFIPQLKRLFSRDGISVNLTAIVKEATNRELYFSDLVAIAKAATYDAGKNIEDDYFPSSVANKPTPTGGFKDISDLSRNYQFVELLKLGGIDAARFNGDKVSTGDEYSKWIVDTRKHIKEFLTRLKKAYPEYNIYFDQSSVAITPISGSVAGVSNVGKQYRNIPEKYIMQFDTFITESNKDNLPKWIKILGSKFPELTSKQANLFNSNIKAFLNYLEQMYGSSILEFRVLKNEENV